MTAPHVYPEPTLLDACEARYGPIDWDGLREHDSLHVSPDPDDGPWISERDMDQVAGYHYPNDGKERPHD